MAQASTAQVAVTQVHRYKIPPPRFNGTYGAFEEWKYKMTAYLGLQDQAYPQLLSGAETATHTLDNDDLETAAPDTTTAEHWKQLGSDLNYIRVNTCDDTAATICRQHATNTGFEIWRQLHIRLSIPIGTRSIGYLTKLLKPQFDEHKFEESYTAWEFEVTRYERDNNTTLPDNVKIAILLNETKGPLQQHLQLQAGSITTYAQIRSLTWNTTEHQQHLHDYTH